MGRRSLQIFLTILGSVALAAGAVTTLGGATSIAGVEAVSPSIDSEMRFFAVWYAAAGVVLLRAVDRVESEGAIVRAVAGLFFLAGCSRLVSLAVVGRPHPMALVLMVIELALPFVLIPWQTAVARRASDQG